MRVLFLGYVDWANVSNRVARGMNAFAGEKIARVCTLSSHSYGYAEDRLTFEDLQEWASSADWIISTGDGNYGAFRGLLASLPLSSDVKIATAHVGKAYREHHQDYNGWDVGLNLRFIAGDLYRFAGEGRPKAVPYFAPPDEVFSQLPVLGDTIKVCHAPSTPSVKGTSGVVDAVPDAEVFTGLSFEECVRRRSAHHIYIDQINDLGGFGAAACEALASGCVVVGSTAKIVEEVDRYYPRPPIVEVTSENLKEVMEDLRNDLDSVQGLREASLAWAQKYASPVAVGRYWLKQLQAV